MIGSFINHANFKSTLPRIPNRFYEPLKLKNWMCVHFRKYSHICNSWVIIHAVLKYWSTHLKRDQNDLL